MLILKKIEKNFSMPIDFYFKMDTLSWCKYTHIMLTTAQSWILWACCVLSIFLPWEIGGFKGIGKHGKWFAGKVEKKGLSR